MRLQESEKQPRGRRDDGRKWRRRRNKEKEKDKSDKIDGYEKPETQKKEGIEKQLRERKGERGRPGKVSL